MTTYIGLLRAVNLGGYNRIGMADLREFLTRLGLQDVKTLLQSGNFVGRSDVRSSSELERLVEGAAAKQLGLTTDVLVRSDTEWKTLIAKTLAQVIHCYPTQAAAIRQAGDAYNRSRLTPLLKTISRRWLAWARRGR